VLTVLTRMASFAYYLMWVGAALVLVAMPVKVFGGTGFHYGLELPVAVPQVDAMVDTALGPAPLKLDAARAELRLPIPMLPWSLVAVLWIYTAAAATLTLLLLHNVRLIFQRVREGAAFGTQNAYRLRTLSVLLFCLAMLHDDTGCSCHSCVSVRRTTS
jgi:hypothetical protein